MQNLRKLPIGIQSFKKLREDNFLYVDKTAFIYKLAQSSGVYFLSRPRRFGKSLFLSTLKAYFEGQKELFSGLKIEELEAENPNAWKKYPVLYFDFNGMDYTQPDSLEKNLTQLFRIMKKSTAKTMLTATISRFVSLPSSRMRMTKLDLALSFWLMNTISHFWKATKSFRRRTVRFSRDFSET